MKKNLPKRTNSHKVETESLNILKNKFGENWIFRNQTERDYGIDIQLERFEEDTPTGDLIYGQVKGTEAEFTGKEKLSGFPTKTVNYANLFAIPFFLFYVSTKSKAAKFVWLQKYFELKIGSKVSHEQNSVTIEFPEENTLDERGAQRIADIVKRTKAEKDAIKFIIHYRRLIAAIDKIKKGDLSESNNCINEIGAIHTSGVLKNYINFNKAEFSRFDAYKAAGIISSITKENIKNFNWAELDRSIFPLSFAELEFLNMDRNYQVCCWYNDVTQY